MRRPIRLFVLWLIFFAASLPLTRPADAREQLVIGMTQFPTTLNPMIDAMLVKSYVLGMAQRQIAIFGHNWEPVCVWCTELPTFENKRAVRFPVLDAEGNPTGREGVRTTYTIKPGAFWGDGTPITTEDVLFSWKVGRHPETGVSDLSAYQEIVDIEVKDERTFTIVRDKIDYRYNTPGDFNLLPAHLERDAFAVPRDYKNRTLYKTAPTTPGLYNGPYRVAELSEGAYIVLVRNEHWQGKKPVFDRIVVKTIEKTAALEANLLSGAVDYIAGEAGLTLDQALGFEKRHGDAFDVIYKPGLIYEHIEFNLDNPILADIRVRRALLHAIDRQAISDRLFAGNQPVAHGAVNPLDWAYHKDLPKYPFDPERAKALLEEAGWTVLKDGIRHKPDGTRLSLEIMTTSGNRIRELVEQVLQNYWKQVGVEVTIRNEPARVFFGETVRKRKFPAMAMFAWLSAPEALPKTTLYSTSIPTEANNWSGQNATGYRSAEMDRLIDAIEVELDREKRRALWAEQQTLYATDLPVLPLYFRSNAYILPKWLKGLRPTGHKYSSTYWIEQWRDSSDAN